MIQMRWLAAPRDRDRVLQYRYRLGGIGVPQGSTVLGSALQMSPDEGWSPWQDVPVVGQDRKQPVDENPE